MASKVWTDAENDLIVADYFAMLSEELAGRRPNKAAHNRALQNQIGRGPGSIEYKHQNISAVLQWLGQPWIDGYKPALNFQGSLVEAVARWLDRRPDYLSPKEPVASVSRREPPGILILGCPPTVSNKLPPREFVKCRRSHGNSMQRGGMSATVPWGVLASNVRSPMKKQP